MKTNSLGFIGGGRVTRIFLKAFTNEKVEFNSVVVYETNNETLAALKAQFPFITIGNLEQAAGQPTVFIALHPPVIMETLEKVAKVVTEDAFVISLAPKITIEKIASKLATKNIARMIPNATSFINKGFNPIVFNNKMAEKDIKKILKLMKKLGKTFISEESKLEAYALTSGILPTYFLFQFKEIEKIAQQCGLTEKEAKKTIKSTMKRALKLYYESELKHEEVVDLIPVKPIADSESVIKEIYQTKLMGLYEKIKP